MRRTFKAAKLAHQKVTNSTSAGTAFSASFYLRSSEFIGG
jgi:hypothetical protein